MKISKEQFLKEFNQVFPNNKIEIINYESYLGELKFKCDICGEIHTRVSSRNILSVRNYCNKKNIGWDEESFKQRLKTRFNHDFELVQYKGLSSPLIYLCPTCGKEKKMSAARALITSHIYCAECCGKEKDVVKTKIETAFAESKKYKLLVWRGVKQKADIQCLACGAISKRYPTNIVVCPDSCPNCNNAGNKSQLPFEENQRRIDDTFGPGKYKLLNYEGQLKKNTIQCLSCGFIFKNQMPVFVGGTGCPKCQRHFSKGKQIIKTYFEQHNIKFQAQKRFPDCNGGLSSFDFCVYGKDGAMTLIEFNGIQHYKQTRRFEDLSTIQKRDKIKQEYCEEHNIPLLIISYKEKDITKLLKRFNDYPEME